MLNPSTASSVAPTCSGRAAGTSQSVPQTSTPAPMPAAAENARLFARSAGRWSGRRAAKTTVASVTPSRAIQAVIKAVTVRKATVPRPDGPSARVTSSIPTNRPEFPTTCAQKSSAGPLVAEACSTPVLVGSAWLKSGALTHGHSSGSPNAAISRSALSRSGPRAWRVRRCAAFAANSSR